MYYVVLGVYVLICFLLLVVVLLQQGKGGDIAAAFGGASSQTAFGARAGATVLTRATTVLGTLFLLGAFALTLMGRVGGGSVVGGIGAPTGSETAAPVLPMPATPGGTAPAPAPAPADQPAAPAEGGTTPAPSGTPEQPPAGSGQ
jgi:preprotein translocase subunit SecG